MQKPQLVAVDTNVLMRLADGHEATMDAVVREVALSALRNFRSRWQFLPVEFNAIQDAITANAIRELLNTGLLPYSERNDASIIAEASILNCILLVSRDSHLLDIDREKLALLFRQLDLSAPIISSQRTS